MAPQASHLSLETSWAPQMAGAANSPQPHWWPLPSSSSGNLLRMSQEGLVTLWDRRPEGPTGAGWTSPVHGPQSPSKQRCGFLVSSAGCLSTTHVQGGPGDEGR